MKKELDRCRLCYLLVNEYISVFENCASTINIIVILKQYFNDEVSSNNKKAKYYGEELKIIMISNLNS